MMMRVGVFFLLSLALLSSTLRAMDNDDFLSDSDEPAKNITVYLSFSQQHFLWLHTHLSHDNPQDLQTFLDDPNVHGVLQRSEPFMPSKQSETLSSYKKAMVPHYTQEDINALKPRLLDLLQEINPFDKKGRFFSLGKIANMIQMDARLCGGKYKPCPHTLEYAFILKDEELKKLYEQTAYNRE